MSQESRSRAESLLMADSFAGLLSFALSARCASVLLSQGAPVGAEEISFYISKVFFLSIPFYLACLGYFSAKGHYALKASWWPQVGHILGASVAAFVVSSLAIYVWQAPAQMVQNIFLWLFAPASLILMRWIARYILIKKGRWAIPTIMVGSHETLTRLAPALRTDGYLVYDVRQAVILDSSAAQIEDFKTLYPEICLYSSLNSLSFEDSYVIFSPGKAVVHDDILAQLERRGVRFAYVPPVEGYFLYKAEPQRFFGHGVIALEPRESFAAGLGLFLKDILDRGGAGLALVLLSPLFIILAWIIKRDGGRALYGHRRIGKNGRPFTCIKFRSMVPNAAAILNELLAKDPAARKEFEETFKLKNDPRVTRIGKFLRKTSLDELPQLLNVLRGEMSLTGPRPIVEDETKYYAEKLGDYLSMKPGITGLWQVSGRSDTDYTRRVYLDGWYARNWSLWNDIIILFKTVLVVLKRKGAY